MSKPPPAPPREVAPTDAPQGIRARVVSAIARVRGGDLTARRLGLSVGLGILVGCSPFYGLHFLIVGALALALRLDVVIAYLASNISIPPVMPVLLFAELQVGSFVMHGRFLSLDVSELGADRALENFLALSVGAGIVGSVLAIVGGGVAFALARRMAQGEKLAARVSTVPPP